MAAALPAPLLLAHRLADNDRGARQQAVRRLRKYLRARTRAGAGGFSEDELIKIWKGLFYCMWMQDKPLLQEDLARTISQLLHCFLNTEGQLLFLRTFWQTMSREWNGLDRLRLDKFYLLERMLLRESFQVLKKNKWEDSFIDPFLTLLMKEVLHTDSETPNGVKFHLIDIYLEELAKVGAAELRAEQNLKFIDPFCKTAAKTKDRHLMSTIAKDILGAILDQAPFAIEDLMKELKQKKVGIDDESDEEEEEEEAAAAADVQHKPVKRPSASDGGLFNEDGDLDSDEEEPIEDIGPVLQFDYSAVADRLFELSTKRFTPPPNRKRFYKLVKRFRNLAEGQFPANEFPEDVSTDEDDDEFSQRWARKKHFRALKLKEKEKKAKERADERASPVPPKKKKKKRKTKTAKSLADAAAIEQKSMPAPKPDEACISGETGDPTESTATCAAGHEPKSAGDAPGTDEKSSSSLLRLLSDPQGKKGHSKKRKVCHKKPVETSLQNGLLVNESEGTVTCKSSETKKLKRTLLREAIESFVQAAPDDSVTDTGKPKKKRKRTPVTGKSAVALADDSCLKATGEGELICKTDRPKKTSECSEVNANALPPQAVEDRSKKVGKDRAGEGLLPAKKLKVKAKMRKMLQSVEPAVMETPAKKKSKQLNEALSATNASPVLSSKKSKRSVLEQDTFVPLVTNPLKKSLKVENDFVKFGKAALPKPLFIRKTKSSVSGGISPKKLNLLLNSGMKKVTFGLSNNKTAEFKKSDKSILVSPDGAPRIAFNPEKKPLHGVLKTPLRRTPLGTLSKKKIKKRATLLSSPAGAQTTALSPLSPKQPTAFSTPTRKPRMVTLTPTRNQFSQAQKQSTALSLLHKKATSFSTPTQKQSKKFSPSQKQASGQKRSINVSSPNQKRATASDFF